MSRVRLVECRWDDNERDLFNARKHALAHQVTLAHSSSALRPCIYSDESDDCWTTVETQTLHLDLQLPHRERHQQPLAFLSGRLTTTQMRRSVFEKETSAVMSALQRLHRLAVTQEGVHLNTNHNNLIFISDLLSVLQDLSVSRFQDAVMGLASQHLQLCLPSH